MSNPSTGFARGATIVIALLATCAAGAAIKVTLDLEYRVADMEKQFATDKAAADATRTMLQARVDELLAGSNDSAQAGDIAARIDALETSTTKLAGLVQQAQADAAKAVDATAGANPFGGGSFTPEAARNLDRLTAEVADLQTRVREMRDGTVPPRQPDPATGDDGKPTLDDVRARLKLDADQMKALHEVLRVQKKEFLDMLSLPDEHGNTAIDKVLTAFIDTSLKPEDKQALLVEVFTSKVPGSQENYSEVNARINQKIMETMNQVMTPEQYEGYLQMNVSATDIKFADDPIGQYAAGRIPELARRLAERKND
ncbi:MAG: hypothetical protein AB7S36_05620 [Planctomycetota bacterium]